MSNVTNISGATKRGEYRVQLYQNAYDNRGKSHRLKSVEEIAQAVVKLISRHSVARERKQYLPMMKFASFNGTRKLEKVQKLYAIECEHDAGEMTSEEVDKILTGADINCIIYDSPSSEPDHPKWRIFFPLSQPLDIKNFDSVGFMAKERGRILARANGLLNGCLAPESDAIVQCWFVGRFTDGRVPDLFFHDSGMFLDQAEELDVSAVAVKQQEKGEGGSGGSTVKRVSDLKLETLITDKDGKTQSLYKWIPELQKKEKIRCQGKTYRPDASGSDSAILEMTQDGRPCFHDVATGITHHLVPMDWDRSDEVLGIDDSYLRDYVFGESQSPTAIQMTLGQMHRQLVQLDNMRSVVMLFDPEIPYLLPAMRDMMLGNTTWVGREKVQSFEIWRNSDNRKHAHSLTFSPGNNRFTVNPSGRLCVNTWLPIERTSIPYEEAVYRAQPFYDHIEWLFKDRAEDFINWLAHIEQHPSWLPHISWLHIAPKEGLGRSWIGSVLSRVWRPYVLGNVDLGKLLDASFNEQLAGKLLGVISEVKEGGRGQWNHRQKFKALITDEERTINKKFIPSYTEFNCTRWLMFSNHENALPLDEQDRRVEVIINRDKPRQPVYYKAIYGALKDRKFIDSVAITLSQRDIKNYDPNKPALFTESKNVLIVNQTDPHSELVKTIKEHWPFDMISAKTLLGAFTGSAIEGNSLEEAAKYRHYMQQFTRLGKFKHKDRKRYTIYIVKNAGVYHHEKAGSVYREYNKKILETEKSASGGLASEEQIEQWREMSLWKDEPGVPLDRAVGVRFREFFMG